uniref:Uncharacterized protein n=1 Tax=Astyanax mexicanus TaxID=7994 RepID=A0A3B1IWE2_ASTMX
MTKRFGTRCQEVHASLLQKVLLYCQYFSTEKLFSLDLLLACIPSPCRDNGHPGRGCRQRP